MLTDQPHPMLVLLHGFGSDEKDLMALRPYIDPVWAIVSIRAPFRQGAGFRWYALEPGGAWDLNEFHQSMEALTQWLEKLPSRFPQVSSDATVIGGFSQGAALALALGLFDFQVPVAGILALSGYLPHLPAQEPTWRNLPVFWGHGENDPVLAYTLAQKGHHELLERGIGVSFHSYSAGHEVVEEELVHAGAWLKQFKSIQRS